MTLNEAVAKLSTLIPVLKANDAKFASDLIASFKKYGGLTPKQEPWIERLIARAETPKPVFSAPLAAPVAVNVGNFGGVIALFNKAKEHLKFPKVRLVVGGTKIVLKLNGPKSKAPGAVSITSEGAYGVASYYGRVTVEGVFQPAHAAYGDFLTALTALLTDFAANPSRVAKDHGKLTGNCCFCNKEIGKGKEKRSVFAGFGPDCAEHYGLKAEWLAAVDKAEAKASVVPAVKDEQHLVSGHVSNPYPADEQAVGVPNFLPAGATDAAAAQANAAAFLAAQEATALAESLAKVTGAVSVTVNDGPVTVTAGPDSYGPNPGDVGDLEPVGDNPKDETVYDAPVTCFFCEKPTTDYKTLHGFVVCVSCVDQLK